MPRCRRSVEVNLLSYAHRSTWEALRLGWYPTSGGGYNQARLSLTSTRDYWLVTEEHEPERLEKGTCK